MKSMMDKEFPIVDFKEGKGQDIGTVIWICSINDAAAASPNMEFSVRPRGTRDERKVWFENAGTFIGKMLTVRFQEWSKDGIPRFPVGIAIRDYE